jgi:gamma-glutamyltranspeptidase / glutathione hydrolase
MPDFAVAAGHRVTAEAAAEVLRAGGTAVDAAIAAGLACMVAEPALAGLLGGGFLMVREPGGRTRALDFFVETPKRKRPAGDLDFRAIEAQFGTATQEFHIGAGSIATPGVAPGLAEAHARYGRMPMTALAQPAITAAREGVRVTDYQSFICGIIEPILTASAAARALFCDGDVLMREGSLFRNPEFADVIEVMAHEGPRFVTEGEVGRGILALCDQGGHLTAADLAGYRPAWREPLKVERAGVRISVNPPPSLGGALAVFSLELLGPGPDAVALARAFAATSRARLEADLATDPVAGAARLLSPALVARYRAELRGRPPATRGTTHISVIDAAGMGAAMTLSNGEGCGQIVPGTGLMPNNMLGEADLVPGGWHSWTPDRRLASMMAPMAVDWPDQRFAMLGSGGSNRIRTALAQVLVRLIDGSERMEPAIEAPRLHVEPGPEARLDPGAPPAVEFEDLAGEAARAALMAAFPQARPWPDRSMYFGGVHGARRRRAGDLEAAGDPRRAGVALTA